MEVFNNFLNVYLCRKLVIVFWNLKFDFLDYLVDFVFFGIEGDFLDVFEVIMFIENFEIVVLEFVILEL